MWMIYGIVKILNFPYLLNAQPWNWRDNYLWDLNKSKTTPAGIYVEATTVRNEKQNTRENYTVSMRISLSFIYLYRLYHYNTSI